MNIEQRLQQIKDDVAKERGYRTWEDVHTSFLANEMTIERYDIFNNTVALRLAKEMCDLQKESDAKASKIKICIFQKDENNIYRTTPIVSRDYYPIDKSKLVEPDRQSILNNPNACNP